MNASQPATGPVRIPQEELPATSQRTRFDGALGEQPRITRAGAVDRQRACDQHPLGAALQGLDSSSSSPASSVGTDSESRAMSFLIVSGISSLAKAQIAVRSLDGAEKQNPWAMPQIRTSLPRRT